MTEAVAKDAPAEAAPASTEAKAPEKSSILGDLKSTKQAPAKTDNVDRASDHMQTAEWFLAEGVPGVGTKPDYLDPRYKNLAEQAKAYKDLEKKLGATAAAPDEYDFGDYKEVVDPSNQHIQEFVKYAKNNRLSQDAFTKTLDTFVNYEKSLIPDINAEIAKLGETGAQRIETVQRWAENNLSEGALKTIGKIAKTADVIELLDEMRQFQVHVSTQPPTSSAPNEGFKRLTTQEVTKEIQKNYKRYCDDPGYRAKITAMFEQAVG